MLISLLQYEIRIRAHYWNIPHDDVIWFIHIAYTTFISKLIHLLKQLKLYFSRHSFANFLLLIIQVIIRH